MIPIGSSVIDRVTGFQGIVTGVASYASGNTQALVEARVGEDGRMPEPQWLDQARLEIDVNAKPVFAVRHPADLGNSSGL